MNSVHIKNLGGANDRGNVQITLGRGGGPDARSLIGETHMKRVAIHVAVHGDRADAHLFAGPDDSAGNLAAIGDQDFAEGSRAVVHKIVDFRLLIADWHFEINTFRPIDTRQSKIANGLCLDSEEGLTVFNGLTVFDVDLHDLTAALSLNLVHQFHGFDDAYHGVGFDLAADTNETFCGWGWRAKESANNRRRNDMQILIFRSRLFCQGARVGWRRGGSTLDGGSQCTNDGTFGHTGNSGRQNRGFFGLPAAGNPDPKSLSLKFEIC